MAKQKEDSKTLQDTQSQGDDMAKLTKQIEKLEQDYLEQLQQLRLGANANIRKPRQLRYEVARLKTRISMLNLTQVQEVSADTEDKNEEEE